MKIKISHASGRHFWMGKLAHPHHTHNLTVEGPFHVEAQARLRNDGRREKRGSQVQRPQVTFRTGRPPAWLWGPDRSHFGRLLPAATPRTELLLHFCLSFIACKSIHARAHSDTSKDTRIMAPK